MTDKPMSPERLDKAIERLNEFVAGARGPYTNIVSDMKTVLAEIDAMRERAEKAEAAAQAEVMASGRAVVKMDVDALKNRLIAAERQRDEALAALEKARADLDYLTSTGNVQTGRPRIVDICYTTFLHAKEPNKEDGGASDWFTDTLPTIEKLIRSLKDQTP